MVRMSRPALILGATTVACTGAALLLPHGISYLSFYSPLHDTFFVVAHLHTFVITGFICAMFAMIYWAVPQLSQGGIGKRLANFHALAMAAVPLLFLVSILLPISRLGSYGPAANQASGPSLGSWIEPLAIVGIPLALLFGNAAFVCASIIAWVKRTR